MFNCYDKAALVVKLILEHKSCLFKVNTTTILITTLLIIPSLNATLTESEGFVPLTSSLRQLVLKKYTVHNKRR
jgi:hypothetical protein